MANVKEVQTIQETGSAATESAAGAIGGNYVVIFFTSGAMD